jgi:hypothetical protein
MVAQRQATVWLDHDSALLICIYSIIANIIQMHLSIIIVVQRGFDHLQVFVGTSVDESSLCCPSPANAMGIH